MSIDGVPSVTSRQVTDLCKRVCSSLTILSLACLPGCDPGSAQKPEANPPPGSAGDSDPGNPPESPPPEIPPASDDPVEPGPLPEPDANLPEASNRFLRPATSCEDFRESIAKIAKRSAQKKVQARLDDFLRRKAMDPEDCQLKEDEDEDKADGGPGPDSDEASDASTTNNQEAGVDEADFVKNDRSKIYVLADGAFQVVQAWPAKQTQILSKTKIQGTPKKMFVHDNRAFIYSAGAEIGHGDPVFDDARWDEECTYGYDCDFVGDGHETLVTELDISDPAAPRIIRMSEISGSLLGARRIGDRVYSVVVYPSIETKIRNLEQVPNRLKSFDSSFICGDEILASENEIKRLFGNLEEQNNERIDELELEDMIPNIDDKAVDPNTGSLVDMSQPSLDCDSLFISQTSDSTNVLSVMGTDMHEPTPYTHQSIFARPGAVYASGATMYVASRHYASQMDKDWWYPEDSGLKDATAVHRFDLFHREKEVRYAGSGITKGRILNQFSLSHHNGYLRLATTTGRLPSLKTHNTLSILGLSEGELRKTGEIDNIAPTEDIRSVRFVGDKGYMVTFKKTDPLFVFDLSDPKAPSIEGELKIPGFSTYIHPMDKDHLLTIGFDAQDEGKFAYFTGIQLQIMDVSNPNNPTLAHKEVIGTRGSASSAATNHLAFNYYRRRAFLALPMLICEAEPGADIFDATMTFNGLLTYHLTPTTGFRRLGGIPLELTDDQKDKSGDICWNWWTESVSPVERSVFMEDFVYAIARNEIRVASANKPSEVLASVKLER